MSIALRRLHTKVGVLDFIGHTKPSSKATQSHEGFHLTTLAEFTVR